MPTFSVQLCAITVGPGASIPSKHDVKILKVMDSKSSLLS